jgi:hypothetical protein
MHIIFALPGCIIISTAGRPSLLKRGVQRSTGSLSTPALRALKLVLAAMMAIRAVAADIRASAASISAEHALCGSVCGCRRCLLLRNNSLRC